MRDSRIKLRHKETGVVETYWPVDVREIMKTSSEYEIVDDDTAPSYVMSSVKHDIETSQTVAEPVVVEAEPVVEVVEPEVVAIEPVAEVTVEPVAEVTVEPVAEVTVEPVAVEAVVEEPAEQVSSVSSRRGSKSK